MTETNTDAWTNIAQRLKGAPANWGTYSVFGSFVLYVMGYLAIRFYLTAFGLVTDLSVLDERYVFAGARFLVYVVSGLTTMLFVAFVLLALGHGAWRVLSKLTGHRTNGAGVGLGRPSAQQLAIVGIALSVLVVQLFMRQVFLFDDLLLRPTLPHSWLAELLLAEDPSYFDYYFIGLLVAAAITTVLLVMCHTLHSKTPGNRGVLVLFTFAWSTQCLFLPVNYGYLLASKTLPRVASLDGVTPLPGGEQAWLVWEGKEGVTFLVRQVDGTTATRYLITMPKAEVKRVKVTGYDRILRTLFVLP